MLQDKMVELVNALTPLVEEAKKADAGNVSAARRLRMALQEAKKALQEVRVDALKSYPVKKVKVAKA